MGNTCCNSRNKNASTDTSTEQAKNKPTKKQKRKDNDKKNSKLVDLNLMHSKIFETENIESLIESRNSYCYGVQIKIKQE